MNKFLSGLMATTLAASFAACVRRCRLTPPRCLCRSRRNAGRRRERQSHAAPLEIPAGASRRAAGAYRTGSANSGAAYDDGYYYERPPCASADTIYRLRPLAGDGGIDPGIRLLTRRPQAVVIEQGPRCAARALSCRAERPPHRVAPAGQLALAGGLVHRRLEAPVERPGSWRTPWPSARRPPASRRARRRPAPSSPGSSAGRPARRGCRPAAAWSSRRRPCRRRRAARSLPSPPFQSFFMASSRSRVW